MRFDEFRLLTEMPMWHDMWHVERLRPDCPVLQQPHGDSHCLVQGLSRACAIHLGQHAMEQAVRGAATTAATS